jgi:hypothetical protein
VVGLERLERGRLAVVATNGCKADDERRFERLSA